MQQFWVFGYGSLMWRPGFTFIESRPAVVHGFHRCLCVYSHVHRGTPERPGLVLGLDRGGSCHGMAFRIDAALWPETLAYLRAREQVTMVYLERNPTIRLLDSGEKLPAVTYVVDRNHRQYAGRLPMASLISHVSRSRGQSGHNAEYVRNTVSHLRDMGIRDATLEELAANLDQMEQTNSG